jgi:hypothetical protein
LCDAQFHDDAYQSDRREREQQVAFDVVQDAEAAIRPTPWMATRGSFRSADHLDTVTAFFVGLGLEVEGTRMFVEGEFLTLS